MGRVLLRRRESPADRGNRRGFAMPGDDRDSIVYQSGDTKLITGGQIRAARGLVRLSAESLAQRAQLGVATVRRAEIVDGEPPITVANNAAIRQALEAAGVIFVEENGEGPGVRLRKKKNEPKHD
jgi:hypothetical protein